MMPLRTCRLAPVLAAALCLAGGAALAEGYGYPDYMGSGNMVLRSAAQQSGQTNYIAVGRAWTGSQYKGLIASYLTATGGQDVNFAYGNGLNGRLVFDFAGAGFDNLCNNVVALGGGSYVAACRSMTGFRFYDIYLVKFNGSGVITGAFGTSGIRTTGLGGTSEHAFIRGMTVGNGGELIVVGHKGTYSPGSFNPFIARFNATTGAQIGSTVTHSLVGSAVDVVYDGSANYYVAMTQTSGNHDFHVAKYSTALAPASAPWGNALSFSSAGGGSDSIPSSIRLAGTRLIVAGGSRASSTTPPFRCAVAAIATASGNLDTTFGQNSLNGAVPANQNQGVSLFTHTLEHNYDCLLNSAAIDSSNRIFLAGSAYNGANYDYFTAKLSATGDVQQSSVRVGGSADDVANFGMFFDGVYTSFYAIGRSLSSSLYNGGAAVKFVEGSDSWSSSSVTNAPSARYAHTVAWTGTRMIVWGGFNDSDVTNTGGLYDPVSNTWTNMSTTNAPSARYLHTEAWTGSQMLVWGGKDVDDPTNTGGAYDPYTDTWTRMSTTNAPAAVYAHVGVWTDSRMLVWSGHVSGLNFPKTGGSYDPETDTWTRMSTTNAPPGRLLAAAAWTGSKMVVWGGYNLTLPVTGGVYDPEADSWTATTTANNPGGRWLHTSVWTGTKVMIWGGYTGSSYLNTGSFYDPSTNAWTAMTTANAPSGRSSPAYAWTGSKMVVWAGKTSDSTWTNSGGSYDLETNAWYPLNLGTGNLTAREHARGIWTGSGMVVWGGREAGATSKNDGSRWDSGWTYTPRSSYLWGAMATGNAPAGAEGATANWTGSQMIVHSGKDGSYYRTGSRYTPTSNTWASMPTANTPSTRAYHTSTWTGSDLITWGGTNGTVQTGNAKFSTSANAWSSAVATGNGPGTRYEHTAVWTGSKVIVWGGQNASRLNTGAVYDPTANTWAAMATGNAPSARTDHSAVWTGSEMLVFGGSTAAATNTGYGYDPSANLWSRLSTTNAPRARYSHVAAWTGFKMFIWGGYDGSATYLSTGAVYDPDSDTWTAMATGNAPSGRSEALGVWTGGSLLVWGGKTGSSAVTNTGGTYDYLSNTWTPTGVGSNVPAGRYGHVGVWTGTALLIYGGRTTTGTYYPNGAVYYP